MGATDLGALLSRVDVIPNTTVTVQRSNTDYDPADPTSEEFLDILPEPIEVKLSPRRTIETLLPTGEVITNPPYKCRMFQDYPAIEIGDIITPQGKDKLFIDSIYRRDGIDYMSCTLIETVK